MEIKYKIGDAVQLKNEDNWVLTVVSLEGERLWDRDSKKWISSEPDGRISVAWINSEGDWNEVPIHQDALEPATE